MIELRMSAVDSTASAISACDRPVTPAVNLQAVNATLAPIPRNVALRLRSSRFVATPN